MLTTKKIHPHSNTRLRMYRCRFYNQVLYMLTMEVFDDFDPNCEEEIIKLSFERQMQ